MPPILALFICTAIVLFLLRLDHKQTPMMSRALWIPTLWILSVASKPLGVWFGAEGENEGSPFNQFFLSILLCIGFLIIASRKIDWSHAIKENTWLILLIGYMFASVLWSDTPFISFKRWIRELVAVVMACCLLSEQKPRLAMETVFRRVIYILIPFSILLIKFYPHYGIVYGHTSGTQMWVGVTMQKNGLGRLCLVAAFFLVWTLIRRWKGCDISVRKYDTLAEVFVLILTLRLLIGPPNDFSATASVSLAIGLVMYCSFLCMKKHRIVVGANSVTAIIAFIIGCGIAQPFVGGASVAGVASNFNRDVTLTGRTEIWADLIPVVMRQPILGSGIGGFWTPKTVNDHQIMEAHSGYLDTILDFGFIGMLLVSMYVLSSSRKAARKLSHDFDWNALWICFLIMASVHNITESSFNSLSSLLPAILLFLTVSSSIAVPKHDGTMKKCNISQEIFSETTKYKTYRYKQRNAKSL